ncbi:MAG: hypothetical protein V2A63_01505 [Patescibacteria group bacterium]
MLKNKLFAFVGLLLLFAANSQNLALAEENTLPGATFQAEDPTTSEVADLKKSLAALQSELTSMKTGMQDLQAKYIESEMEKLQQQLAAIRGGSATSSTTALPNLSDFYTLPTTQTNSIQTTDPNTIPVTKIEDFVGFSLDGEDAKTVKTETAKVESVNEVEGALASADDEIAKLEKLLEDKKDQTNDADIKQKIKDLKTAKTELAKIKVEDTIAAEAGQENSNKIIAQNDGEVLFQYPRAISQKENAAGAGNLTADVLKAEQTENKEHGASAKSWDLFSANSLAILIGLIAVAVAIFATWLVRNERRLLAATSRRFAQLELKPNFDLKNRAQKTNPSDKNIIQ